MNKSSIFNVATATHGRVLVDDAAELSGTLVACHGYGQHAEDILRELRRVPGIGRWRRIAPMALHRFYTRDSQKVIASWMTREDRELAIADNVAYIDRVLDQAASLRPQVSGGREVEGPIFLGFSQGASMAYRAAVLGKHRATAVIAVAGDIPPELKSVPAQSWPRVLVAGGTRDQWFTPARVDDEAVFLSSHDIAHEVVRYDGAHEWTDELCKKVGEFLGRQ